MKLATHASRKHRTFAAVLSDENTRAAARKGVQQAFIFVLGMVFACIGIVVGSWLLSGIPLGQ